jgi:crotonobetainyl-CoA:carnitine CoA-transferase CaiB-like acyl-CoA transferase
VPEPGDSYAYPGVDTDAVLAEFGFDATEVASLRDAGAIA